MLYDALLKELGHYLPLLKDKKIVSIYFGGGTPAIWSTEYLRGFLHTLLRSLNYDPNIEITLEVNPEEVTPELSMEWLEIGFNRFSLGIQAYDDGLLHLLGRQHSGAKALKSVEVLAHSGAANISVDAMYDIPDQSMAQWTRTLEHLIELPITHISLYNLTIEPHTLFFKYRHQLEPRRPAEDVSAQMYLKAVEFLNSHGLKQYEISAFAKPGCHSIHNTGYWTGRPFIGLGPSAFSYWNGKRFRNIPNLNRYCSLLDKGGRPVDFEEKLEEEAALRELIAIRLRLLEGFSLSENISASILKDIEAGVDKGWLKKSGRHIALTERGILFYDSLAAEII